jgi:trehalose 6-phosphate phosphatase
MRGPDRSWAYFLDIDGTLVAIADSPRAVRIAPALRGVIEALHAKTGGAVALITGRRIADVDHLFPGLHLPVAGQHGVERRSATGRHSRHPFPAGPLDEVRTVLRETARRHAGLLIEDKDLSIALHYRRDPRLGGYAHRLARAMVSSLGPDYCVQSGKRVVEIRPSGRDKGTAIEEFMREFPFQGRLPIFLGDDATDEYGFAAVNRLGGYSVKVGRGRTAARWRLRDDGEVRSWLQLGRPALREIP